VLRFDLRPHGIGVSLVCPGGVKTPLVGTVEIVGVDPNNRKMQKLKRRFESRAVSPEHVAEKILAGVEKNRYLVFTSPDIRLLFGLQRWFPPAYELVMRELNRRLVAVAN
jgi:short-subunit dehydrogenase